mmetsp:Transcript_24634/g.72015  ORF Transcript_24634/g.72015 Transcript_24634/m.72015 type:complete len:293 (-) Transcript_24634:149-1027(-)
MCTYSISSKQFHPHVVQVVGVLGIDRVHVHQHLRPQRHVGRDRHRVPNLVPSPHVHIPRHLIQQRARVDLGTVRADEIHVEHGTRIGRAGRIPPTTGRCQFSRRSIPLKVSKVGRNGICRPLDEAARVESLEHAAVSFPPIPRVTEGVLRFAAAGGRHGDVSSPLGTSDEPISIISGLGVSVRDGIGAFRSDDDAAVPRRFILGGGDANTIDGEIHAGGSPGYERAHGLGGHFGRGAERSSQFHPVVSSSGGHIQRSDRQCHLSHAISDSQSYRRAGFIDVVVEDGRVALEG